MRVLSLHDHLWLPNPQTGEYLPDRTGGAQLTTHELSLALQARGIPVAVLAATPPGSEAAWRAPGRHDVTAEGYWDEIMGYPVYRRRRPAEAIAEVAAIFEPTVVIVQFGHRLDLARAAIAAGLPTVIYHQDVQLYQLFRGRAWNPAFEPGHPLLHQVANSDFTAQRYERVFGIEMPVVLPLVRPESYRTETTRRNLIFINPIQAKGLDVAIGLAKLRPDIRFEFVESWPLGEYERRELEDCLQGASNVGLRGPIADMREAYREAKLLLAPSRWEEGWGRVVMEAQLSGIPVLASTRGGLPEAVGPGGMVIDCDADPLVWGRALARMWNDESEYARLSEAARTHAQREEVQADSIADRFVDILSAHTASRRKSPASAASPLRILCATTGYHLPNAGGGGHQSVSELCLRLRARGVPVAVLTGTGEEDPAIARRSGRDLEGADPDESMGYPVYRRDDPIAALAEVAASFEPTLVLATCGALFEIAAAAVAARYPTIAYFRDVEFHWLYREKAPAPRLDPRHPLLRFLANSAFTAERVRRVFDVDIEVVRSVVDFDAYRTVSSRRTVLFVNPIGFKGLDIALRLAKARPDIPFEFLESWPLRDEGLRFIEESLRDLPNVTFRRRVEDMREIYRTTKLVLAPSRWQESLLRVAIEAQASGIPTLGSIRGGIPDTIGAGGITVDPDGDFGDWERALSRLWDDAAEYERLSEAARARAERPEIQPAAILDRLLEIFTRHVVDCPPPSPRVAPVPDPRPLGLSIVIPTYGRPDGLDRLLGSLRDQLQGRPDRQAIVVNDGSHDERFAEVIERHKDYVEYVALPRNAGPSAARNAGAERARHPFLVFVDDDCAAPPHWLDWLGAVLDANPDIDAVGGTTRPLPSPCQGLLMAGLSACRLHPAPYVMDDRITVVVTACCAIRRSRFEAVGGFNEAMRFAEDRNLTYRLLRDGAIFFLDESWYVYHDMTGTLRQHLHRYANYGRGIAVQIALEEDPPDASSWPLPGRGLEYWLTLPRIMLSYLRLNPSFTSRPWPQRLGMFALALSTRCAAGYGIMQGLRAPKAMEQLGLRGARLGP